MENDQIGGNRYKKKILLMASEWCNIIVFALSYRDHEFDSCVPLQLTITRGLESTLAVLSIGGLGWHTCALILNTVTLVD